MNPINYWLELFPSARNLYPHCSELVGSRNILEIELDIQNCLSHNWNEKYKLLITVQARDHAVIRPLVIIYQGHPTIPARMKNNVYQHCIVNILYIEFIFMVFNSYSYMDIVTIQLYASIRHFPWLLLFKVSGISLTYQYLDRFVFKMVMM